MFAVKELPDRYGIGKTKLYENYFAAMKKADFGEPQRKGVQTFVNDDQLKFLDALDLHLQKPGASMEDFLYGRYGIGQEHSASRFSQLTANDSEPSLTLAVMAQLATALERLKPETKVLDNFYQLQDATDNGWLIPSSKLATLLGLHSLRGDQIERYGFRCERIAKNGRESEWKISRS